MRETIRAVVQTTFANTGILRQKHVARIEAWLSRPEIIIIKGVRRCGKSFILQQVASRLKGKAAYVNFDDYRLLPYLSLALLDEITRRGIIVRDPDVGLVDFPSLRDGREILLCWRADEDRIAYWHSMDTGYAGRQPL